MNTAKKSLFKVLGFNVFLCIVSITYLISALSIGAPISEGRLTASFFPILVGIVAVGFSIALFIQQLKQYTVETSGDLEQVNKFLAPGLILATFLFIVLFQPLGYFLSAAPYVLSVIIIFSGIQKIFIKVILSLIIVVCVYLLFAQIFNVRLPTLMG